MCTKKWTWSAALVSGALGVGLLLSSTFLPKAAAQQGRPRQIARKQSAPSIESTERSQGPSQQLSVVNPIPLASGVAKSGSGPAPEEPNTGVLLWPQYAIQAPAGAKQLRVELNGDQDVDLYVRFAEPVDVVDGELIADFVSGTDFNSETIAVSPSSSPTLRAGVYYIAVGNFGPGAANFTVKATVVAEATGVVVSASAADYRTDVLAGDQMIAAFGAGLATEFKTVVPNFSGLPETLAGTRVRVVDSAGIEAGAKIYFVSPTQVNYLMPAGLALGPARVTLTSGDGTVSTGAALIGSTSPGLFTAGFEGQTLAVGTALRVRANGSQSYEDITGFDAANQKYFNVPIDLEAPSDQVFLILYGSGFRGRSALSSVSVTIGGTAVETLYAGPQGSGRWPNGYFGLDQLNVRLPRSLAGRGDVDVVMTADGRTSNPVKINLRKQ